MGLALGGRIAEMGLTDIREVQKGALGKDNNSLCKPRDLVPEVKEESTSEGFVN